MKRIARSAIVECGADAFYDGPIAEDLVRAVRAQPRPGDMTLPGGKTINIRQLMGRTG